MIVPIAPIKSKSASFVVSYLMVWGPRVFLRHPDLLQSAIERQLHERPPFTLECSNAIGFECEIDAIVAALQLGGLVHRVER